MAGTADYDVLIVGGGPVGLLLGNLLGRKGLRTLLVEKTAAPPVESMAIGITPPSLELFQQLGLADEFVGRGVRVTRAKVHEERRLAGELSFHGLDNPYPFILAIPQATTIEILEKRLKQEPLVSLRRGTTLIDLAQVGQRVTASVQAAGVAGTEQVSATFLIGCDGHRSTVRDLANIALCEKKDYRVYFLMADFTDATDLDEEAHLFFSRHGSIESFPLPEGRRRWILQTDRLLAAPDTELLIQAIRRQAGYDLNGSACFSSSVFGVRRFVCQRYHRKRLALCGDAAHAMSPVGGQGMNTGFADAECLADALDRHFSGAADFEGLFAGYDQHRRAAFKVAASRAERGMWLGTRRGRLASVLRLMFFRSLLGPLFRKPLPAYFAMLTIPHRSLKAISGEKP